MSKFHEVKIIQVKWVVVEMPDEATKEDAQEVAVDNCAEMGLELEASTEAVYDNKERASTAITSSDEFLPLDD